MGAISSHHKFESPALKGAIFLVAFLPGNYFSGDTDFPPKVNCLNFFFRELRLLSRETSIENLEKEKWNQDDQLPSESRSYSAHNVQTEINFKETQFPGHSQFEIS